MGSDTDVPTTEAIAKSLDVDPDTVRQCVERDLDLTLAHLIAFSDLTNDEIDNEVNREIKLWFHEYAWREFVTERSESGYLIDTAEKCERLRLLRCPICGADWFSMWAERMIDPLGEHLNEEHGAEDVPCEF